jgi:hypothetical protein
MDTQTAEDMTMTYKIQIDDLVRDATEEEAAAIDAQVAEAVAQAEAQVAKATARQALLEKLGITEEEAQLLLGGV